MKKFENFCFVLQNLKEIFDFNEPYGNVVLTGLVVLYEICFEQSWKAMKEILERDGIPASQTGSPRQILKSAYQTGLITKIRSEKAHGFNRGMIAY